MAWAVEALRRTGTSGTRMIWGVAKVLVPAVMMVTVLDRTGWLERMAGWTAPAMAWFGLPGEAALIFVAGFLLNFYAGLAVLAGLALPAREATIAAAMLMNCHGLLIDSALQARTGSQVWPVVAARLFAAVGAGLLLHLVLGGGR